MSDALEHVRSVDPPPVPSSDLESTDVAFSRWLRSKELILAWVLSVITLIFGFTNDVGIISIFVALLEVTLATAIWAVRSSARHAGALQRAVALEFRSLREDLRQTHSVLTDLAKIQDQSVLESLASISKSIAKAKAHPLLFEMMRRDISEMADAVQPRGSGGYDVRARKKGVDIYRMFDHYMDALRPGWSYDTVSSLNFWSPSTIQQPNDFLEANRKAAERGVQIRRVFVISKDAVLATREQTLLEKHAAVATALPNLFQCRVTAPDALDSHELIGNYAICSLQDKTRPLLLEMHYTTGASGTSVEFERIAVVSAEETVRRHRNRFDRLFEGAETVSEYLARRTRVPPTAARTDGLSDSVSGLRAT